MVGYEGTYLDRAHAIQRALYVGHWETTQGLVILHVLSAYTTGNSGCSTPVIALYYDRDNTPQVTWPGLLSGTCLQGPEKALRNSRLRRMFRHPLFSLSRQDSENGRITVSRTSSYHALTSRFLTEH